MPNDSPLDFRRGFLLFDIEVVVTPALIAPYQRLAFGSWCWVERMRYHSSGDQVEEVDNYNRVYSQLFTQYSNPDYMDAIGQLVMGTGTPAQRDVVTTGAGVRVRYCLPISLGFFGVGVIPYQAFKNQYHELEIFLAPANTFVETNGTNPIVTISNLDFHVEQISSWDGSYERSLNKLVDMGNFAIWFESNVTFLNNVINQQQDLVIAQRNESLNHISSFFTNLMNVTDTTVNDKFITFPKNAAFSFQLKINTKLWPEEEVECVNNANHAYMFYLQNAQQWKVNGMPGYCYAWPQPSISVPNINIDAFNAADFFMVTDLRSTPYASLLNNLSTEVNSMDLIFKLKLSALPPPQTGIYHVSNYNIVVNVLPSGKVFVRS